MYNTQNLLCNGAGPTFTNISQSLYFKLRSTTIKLKTEFKFLPGKAFILKFATAIISTRSYRFCKIFLKDLLDMNVTQW